MDFSASSSLFELLAKVLTIVWPLISLVFIIAGVIFVKTVPRVYNWCFLIGSCMQFFGGMFVPLMALSNTSDMIMKYYGYVSAFNLVGGILVAYGIIGHAVSYSRMAGLLQTNRPAGNVD